MTKVILLASARFDYIEAYGWYEKKSKRAAEGFRKAVDHGLARVAQAPESWPILDEPFRFFKLKKYPFLLVYHVAGSVAEVIALAHTKRDESYWRNRLA